MKGDTRSLDYAVALKGPFSDGGIESEIPLDVQHDSYQAELLTHFAHVRRTYLQLFDLGKT